MKALYRVRVKNKGSGQEVLISVASSQEVYARLTTKDKVYEYELNYKDKNQPSSVIRGNAIVHDIIRVCEWLALKYENESTDDVDTNIQHILDKTDDIWEITFGLYQVIKGEYKSQEALNIMTRGYKLIEKHIDMS